MRCGITQVLPLKTTDYYLILKNSLKALVKYSRFVG